MITRAGSRHDTARTMAGRIIIDSTRLAPRDQQYIARSPVAHRGAPTRPPRATRTI
jgi:hypothetical protein